MHHAVKTWCIVSMSGRFARVSNSKAFEIRNPCFFFLRGGSAYSSSVLPNFISSPRLSYFFRLPVISDTSIFQTAVRKAFRVGHGENGIFTAVRYTPGEIFRHFPVFSSHVLHRFFSSFSSWYHNMKKNPSGMRMF